MDGKDRPARNATLKDVARDVGISAMAVSKALNGKGGVSPDTMARIQEAVKRLNYVPNVVAKSLRLNSTKTIGVVVSDSSHSFFAKVVKGIEDTASAHGYNIILCNTDQSLEREMNAVRVLINKRLDGLILAASMLTKKEDAAFLRNFGVPFVFLIRRSEAEDVDYVINDNVIGACQMVRYLVKSGSDRIHFINLYRESPSGSDRLVGYRQALAESGLPFDPRLVYNIRPTIEDGYTVMRQLLDRGEDVKTVFCGCDVIGIGVLEALFDKGLKVPGDVRVAAYDDIDFASYLRVPLTTVRQPKHSIGCKGTELLIARIGGAKQEPQHLILKPELIIRQST